MAIAEITAALSGLKAATELAKVLASTNTSFEVAEFKLKAADMMTSLADARIALASAQDAVGELQAEVRRLKEALEHRNEVVRAGSAYYDIGENGQPKGDPYCMRCWESDRKLRHLSLGDFMNNPAVCPECKSEFSYGQASTRP